MSGNPVIRRQFHRPSICLGCGIDLPDIDRYVAKLNPSIRIRALKPNRPMRHPLRSDIITVRSQNGGKHAKNTRMVRPQGNGALNDFRSLSRSPHAVQRCRQIGQRIAMLRIEIHRQPKHFRRLDQPPRFKQRTAEIVEDRSIARSKPHRLRMLNQRLFPPPQFSQHQRQGPPAIQEIRMRIDRLPQQRHSLFPPPLLKPQKPKEAKQIRVAGRGGQQLQICGFSIVKPAGTVEFKRLPEVSALCHFHGTSMLDTLNVDVRHDRTRSA